MRLGGIFIILAVVSGAINGLVAGWYITHSIALDIILGLILVAMFIHHRKFEKRNRARLANNERIIQHMCQDWAQQDAARLAAMNEYRTQRHERFRRDPRLDRITPQDLTGL